MPDVYQTNGVVWVLRLNNDEANDLGAVSVPQVQ